MKIISKDEYTSKMQFRIDGYGVECMRTQQRYLTMSAPVSKDLLEAIADMYLKSFEYRCKSDMLIKTRDAVEWQQAIELDNGVHILVDMKVESGGYSGRLWV